MARQVEGPWYRQSKGTWYATVEGKSVSLGVKGEDNGKEAQAAWHRLMADGSKPKPEPKADKPTVRELVDAFLADAGLRLKASTVKLYRADLTALCARFGKQTAADLTPTALSGWISGLKVNNTTKAMTLRSVSACLGWAVRNDILTANPAKKVAKPKGRSRSQDAVISDADHTKLMEAATPEFGIALRVLHGTGCRPGEACRITAETFDHKNAVVVLAEHKADHTGKPRVIFLTPELVELLKAQTARYGSGPLLRSRAGVAWNIHSIGHAFARLRRKTGVKGIAYGYRHGYATSALAHGVPDAQVAALLGHSSTSMLHRHYSHLTSRADVLRQAAARVRG